MDQEDQTLESPVIPVKGLEGGICNRQHCDTEPALWINHDTGKWYCGEHAHEISSHPPIYQQWMKYRWPRLQHPMFEMRQDMTRREAQSKSRSFGPRSSSIDRPSRFIRRYGRHVRSPSQ